MAKIFVHVTRVKNAMGFEQPITTLTSISGKSKKNDYVCGKCGAKLAREEVLDTDGTCPKCGEPIHMGTAFLNKKQNKKNGARWSTTDIYPQVEGKRKELIKDPSKSLGETLKPGKPGTLSNAGLKVGDRVKIVGDPHNRTGNRGKKGIVVAMDEWAPDHPIVKLDGDSFEWAWRPEEVKKLNAMPGTLANRGPLPEEPKSFRRGDKVTVFETDEKRWLPGTIIQVQGGLPKQYKVKLDGGGEGIWGEEHMELKNSNTIPPDSGFEKEAAIAERRGSSAKNNDEFEVGDRVKLTPSAKRMPSTKERGVENLTGIVTSVKGDDLMVKFEDGQSLWFMTHELLKVSNSKNADRSRPTDVDTWDDVPGMKNADFEVGDTVTVDKPGNSYNGSVGTVMVLHEGGEYADVRFAGIGTKLVHLNNLKPGGRRKNTEGRKSNPGWLASKDEGKWSKAKEAVKKEYGEIKWPIVTKVFEKMGGKPK